MLEPSSTSEFPDSQSGEARALGDDIPAGIARFDRDGRLLAANAALARLLGRAVESGQPADAFELKPASGTAPAPVARALRGEAIAGEDFQLTRPDGTVTWVRLSAGPLRPGDDGPPAGAWLVLTEVGERRSLEGVREQLLGVVAHDLRNPMSAMRMTLAMLSKNVDMPTERRLVLADRLQGTLGRMEGLVNTLAEHARAELGVALRLERGKVDLSEVLARALAELQALYPNRAPQVRREGELSGHWDAARLERVLVNLVGNALKHGSDAAPVTVALDGTAADRVRLTVHNQGAPISAELLPVVFDAFTTGSFDKQGRRRGIGLGLHIAGLLAGAHGGSLQLQSTAEAGTTATLTLPRSAPGS